MTSATADPDCLFCKIIAGEIPGDIVHETERTVAFRDVNPQAPLHVLVVPRDHYADAAETAAADQKGFAELFTTAREVADMDGLDGYRLVFNTGESAGQVVFHAHLHVLGGRGFGWPPG